MTTVLRANGLHKRFGATVALSGLDLQAVQGECVGLVGPNGGGRSTLLKILATLLRPTAGSLEIAGIDAVRAPFDARRLLAYVGEEAVAGHGLSAHEYLAFIASARRARLPRSAVDDVLMRAGVRADADVDTLSTGNRRRVSLAAVLLIKPQLLLLDDPFAGLDADARVAFSVWLSEVRDAGTTIIAALNEDRDVRAICHRVVRLETQASGAHRATAVLETVPV
jgi:ABC-2 type transport system ATP-binding protein